MTMITSKYLADLVLAWEAGSAMPTAPANLYAALLTAMPTDNVGTSLAEVTGNAYARATIPAADWTAPAGAGDNLTEQSTTNTGINFNTPTPGGWGTVVGVATYDAATNGHFLRAMTLTGGSQVIGAGATVTIPIADLVRQVV